MQIASEIANQSEQFYAIMVTAREKESHGSGRPNHRKETRKAGTVFPGCVGFTLLTVGNYQNPAYSGKAVFSVMGRKSKWINEPTAVRRVPAHMKKALLFLAQKADAKGRFKSQEGANAAIIEALEENLDEFISLIGQIDSSKPQPGYIYILDSQMGFYKIGRTKNLKSRFNHIAIQLPFKVKTVHTIPVSDSEWAEAHLKKKFAHCRANGEWFSLTQTDIDWIKSLTRLEP